MFLGFNYLFVGKEKEGKELLTKIQGIIPDHAITTDTVSEDFLAGFTDADSIRVIYSEVDETKSSILNKRKKIQEVVSKYPKFRQGLMALAITHLQLGREKEALPILERYIELHPTDPTVNYYLSAIYLQRRNYPQSWKYLKIAENLVKTKNHNPKAIQEIRKKLQKVCPDIETRTEYL